MAALPPAPPPSAASASMRSNRRCDTEPELRLRRALHAAGHRYRVDYPIRADGKLVRPDVVFTRSQLAVFVDGCFWHMCPEHCRIPSDPTGYWHAKLAGNRDRDERTTERLHNADWQVVRLWEHLAVADAVDTIETALAQLRRESG